MGIAEKPDALGVFVDAQEVAAVGFEIFSAPVVASCLVFERQFRLIGQHEVAVIKQPRPMLFAAGKLALFDFSTALIEQLVADQVAGADIGREKRVALIHVQGVEIPLHRPMLCDVQHQFGTGGHAEGGQENAGEMPDDEDGERDADNQCGAAAAARLSLRAAAQPGAVWAPALASKQSAF